MSFKLIQTFENQKNANEVPKHNIKYQQYIIEVDGDERSIFIPLRESTEFENYLSEKRRIDEIEFRKMLRTFRGVRS